MSSTIFVCGATGTQGGAIAHRLLKHGVKVHALTRSIDSPAAKQLQSLGAHITSGDFNNEEDLKHSIKNCTGLFLNLMPSFANLNLEIEQAHRIISIAKEAGVKHIVYSSSLALGNERVLNPDSTSLIINALRSKVTIEDNVRNAGFDSWTILRPGSFMTNYLLPHVQMYRGFLETGRYNTALTKETLLPLVDPNDIGQFGAAAFMEPLRFNGKEVEVVSEMLGLDAVMQILSDRTGKDLSAVYLSQKEIDEQVATNIFVSAEVAMRDLGQLEDLEKAKAWGLQLGAFAHFLEREHETVGETYN